MASADNATYAEPAMVGSLAMLMASLAALVKSKYLVLDHLNDQMRVR